MYPYLQGTQNTAQPYNPQQTDSSSILQMTAPATTFQNAPNLVQPGQGYTFLDAQDTGQIQGAETSLPDPYAKYGGQDAYNNLVSGFDTQKQNIYGTSREAANNAAIGRNSSILDFIQGLTTGQRAIDEQGVQNELARVQGRGSILDMVGRGIRSGGTMLANKNASNSSATEALARAVRGAWAA